MAINFPTSLDVFTDPTASDQLNLPSHSGQHTDLNNAVEALEAKVGADSSAVTTSHDYKIAQLEQHGEWVDFSGSFALTNWTLGNGTIIICKYAQIGKVVHYVGDIILGSTSTTIGDLRVNLPVTAALGYAQQSGLAKYFDIGTALHAGMCMFENQTTLNMMVLDSTGSKIHLQNVGTSNPFAWSAANNDRFIWQITYEAA